MSPAKSLPDSAWLRSLSASSFTPSQQVALLTLRNCALSVAIVAKVRSSTVRAGAADYHTLADMGLAERGPDGWHQLTDLGRMISGAVARELAAFLKLPRAATPRRRTGFTPGLFSQAGNC